MNVIFLEEASREFSDAFVYYESHQPRLELRFGEEIDRAIRWILEHPHVCALRRGVYRRLNLHIFPYYIPYVIPGSNLWIVAIAHARRRPEYWIRRTPGIE